MTYGVEEHGHFQINSGQAMYMYSLTFHGVVCFAFRQHPFTKKEVGTDFTKH